MISQDMAAIKMECRPISIRDSRGMNLPKAVIVHDFENLQKAVADGNPHIKIKREAFNTPYVLNFPSDDFHIPKFGDVTMVRDGHNEWIVRQGRMGLCARDMVLRQIGGNFLFSNYDLSGLTNYWGERTCLK